MITFTVEIREDIVTWLKKSTRPEIVLDLPSAPEPGDKLWLKSMRGTHVVETVRCMIVESCRVSRLRPTVRLVLVLGIASIHGHSEFCELRISSRKVPHALLPETIRSILSQQYQKKQSQVRERILHKSMLLTKRNIVIS
ncbi:TPA: hypothetical protein ACYEOW_000736 [Raoultella terrigena]|uniref:Uncharacterized protein n=1 Tax=Raoultella terrigena TaxID=577 RepID=A0AAP9XM85_RAOTE|nr:hypothetical protein [Raoultella terrigena]QPF07003.1 hypothetical protein IMO34_16775 [Raoultella terrigena]